MGREYSHSALSKTFLCCSTNNMHNLCGGKKNVQLQKYASHSCLFSSAKSSEKAFPVVVRKKAAPYILKFVDFYEL